MSRVSVGICVSHIQREFDPARGTLSTSPTSAQRIHCRTSVHILEIHRRCRAGRPRVGRKPDRARLAQRERRTLTLEFRSAARDVAHNAVYNRDGIARRIATQWLERRCLQRVDGVHPDQCRHRPTANTCVSRFGQRHRCDGKHPSGLHRKVDLRCSVGIVSESRRLCCAGSWPVGECRPKHHHRARSVYDERVHGQDVPSE